MISALHALLAVAAWALLWRGLDHATFLVRAPDRDVASAFALAVLIASAVGSTASLVAGRAVWSPWRALSWDVATFVAAGWAVALLSLGAWTRDLGGVMAVAVVVVRLAPGALAVVAGRAPAWLALVVAFGGYAALAAWLPVASLPLGDQIHYLLVADRLGHGGLDATIDDGLFLRTLGIPPSPDDAATHVAATPLGPRPVQGYAMPLLVLPGWALAGRLGAGLVIAAVAAWTSFQTYLILRDVCGPRSRAAGWTWLIASALAPLSLLATHVYPNAAGAALVATAYRAGFTAPDRRPALAAGVLALTLFLTPRDAVALVVLLPFLLRARVDRARVAIATGAVAVAAVVSNAALYGLPVPYAGYVFGTGQAQDLTGRSSITAMLWVTLPAILFDRTFGIAGTAPWAFVGLVGLVSALRADASPRVDSELPADGEPSPGRARLLPAALTVGASVLALSFFRLWEGGYAPPARYFVDVLPLWTPFVAYGLALAFGAAPPATAQAVAPRATDAVPGATGVALRVGVAALVAMSAVTTLVLDAVPSLALNSAFDDKIRFALGQVMGIDLLGWLPSFQPVSERWYVGAYLSLVPALAGAAALVVSGIRPMPLSAAGVRDFEEAIGSAADTGEPPLRSVADPRMPLVGGRSRPTAWWSPTAWQSGLHLFVVVNLLAIAWVAVAAAEPGIASATDPVPESLFRKWLPLSLALAALGTALVAQAIAPERRGPVLARHFLLYLVPAALLLVAHFGAPAVLDGQLGAVYLLVAAGFAVNAVAALWGQADRMGDRAAALRLAAVALVAAVVLLPYHRAVMPTASDEPHYLIVVESLVEDHDLDVRNEYEGDRYMAFYPSRLPDVHGVRVGDAIYSIRDLGMPLLAAVPFAVAGRLGVLALMCVVGAALAAQLYLLLRDLRFAPRVALLATATTALVHPAITYTTQIYPELLTALAFVTAVRVIRRGAASTAGQLALASALVGTLPWLSTRAWPIAVGVGAVVAYAALAPRRRDPRIRAVAARVAAGALPFAAFVLALAYVNWRTFGLFLPSAGYFLIREQQPVLTYTAWIGGPGLLVDRVFGIVPRAPIYLLAFVGIVPLVRRARVAGAGLVALAAGALLSFVYIADIQYWWADGSPPSRYLIGSIPLLVAGVAGGWEVVLAGPGWSRALAWLAVIASGAVAYLYATLPSLRYDLALDIRATGSSGALFGFLDRATGVDPGLAFPSLVRADVASAALVVAWLAAAAALALAGRRAL